MRPSGGGSRPDRDARALKNAASGKLAIIRSAATLQILPFFFFRLYYPWPYNLHLLAGAWLVIAVTLGMVVAGAAGGRITYHRIVGAILLYLLIAVAFATLFAFVGLSISEVVQGDRVQR